MLPNTWRNVCSLFEMFLKYKKDFKINKVHRDEGNNCLISPGIFAKWLLNNNSFSDLLGETSFQLELYLTGVLISKVFFYIIKFNK